MIKKILLGVSLVAGIGGGTAVYMNQDVPANAVCQMAIGAYVEVDSNGLDLFKDVENEFGTTKYSTDQGIIDLAAPTDTDFRTLSRNLREDCAKTCVILLKGRHSSMCYTPDKEWKRV